jgi:hypothetical protein
MTTGAISRRFSASRAIAVTAAVVVLLGTAAAAAAATSTGSDALTPYGSGRVAVPYKRIYAFRVRCAAVPCKISLSQRFYADGRPLPLLRELRPGPIVMRQQPSPGQPWVTWYTPADFNQTMLDADLVRFGRVTLRLSATMADAAGGGASAKRTITLVLAPLPVFIAGTYRGRRPTSIYLSGDAGNVVVNLRWSSWTASSATGTGTSDIQGCVPDCASGTETPVPASITLVAPTNGYFTKLIERRAGKTEVFVYTPNHLPDDWPDFAS